MLHLFLSLSKTLQCRTSWGVSVRSPEQKLDQRNTSDKLVVGIYQVKFLSNSVLWSCFLLNPSPGVSSPLEGKQPNLAVLAASVSSQLEKLSLHKQVQKFISSLFLSLLFNHHISWNPFFYRPSCPPLLHHLYLADTMVSVSSFNFLIDSASISTGLFSSLPHRDAGKKARLQSSAEVHLSSHRLARSQWDRG